MYKISDLNIGDMVILNDGVRGKIVGLLDNDCQDELDIWNDVYIKEYPSPSGMGLLGICLSDIDSVETKGV